MPRASAFCGFFPVVLVSLRCVFFPGCPLVRFILHNDRQCLAQLLSKIKITVFHIVAKLRPLSIYIQSNRLVEKKL